MLSVVTKTGTNEFAGSLYDYFRDDSLTARTETERQSGADKQEYNRDQYGATLGGPIVRDRAHFFATYEQARRGQVLHHQHRRRLPRPRRQLAADAVRGRADHGQGDRRHRRHAAPHACATASRRTARSTAPARSRRRTAWALSPTSTSRSWPATPPPISANMLNEFFFQYTNFDNLISADSDNPTLIFPSGARSGQNLNTPQTTFQTKYQYKDDLSMHHRPRWRSPRLQVRRRTTSTSPTSAAPSPPAPRSHSPCSPTTRTVRCARSTQFGGFAGFSTPVEQYGGYIQDDWYINDRLTLYLGVPLRLLGRLRPRPAVEPDLAGAGRRRRSSPSRTCATSRAARRSRERRRQLSRPASASRYDIKGDSPPDPARRLRNVLRLPLHQRHHPLPVGGGAVELRDRLQPRQHTTGIRNPDGSLLPRRPAVPAGRERAAARTRPTRSPRRTLATPYSEQISAGYSWQVNPTGSG